jgi:hypothetical protein
LKGQHRDTSIASVIAFILTAGLALWLLTVAGDFLGSLICR